MDHGQLQGLDGLDSLFLIMYNTHISLGCKPRQEFCYIGDGVRGFTLELGRVDTLDTTFFRAKYQYRIFHVVIFIHLVYLRVCGMYNIPHRIHLPTLLHSHTSNYPTHSRSVRTRYIDKAYANR